MLATYYACKQTMMKPHGLKEISGLQLFEFPYCSGRIIFKLNCLFYLVFENTFFTGNPKN